MGRWNLALAQRFTHFTGIHAEEAWELLPLHLWRRSARIRTAISPRSWIVTYLRAKRENRRKTAHISLFPYRASSRLARKDMDHRLPRDFRQRIRHSFMRQATHQQALVYLQGLMSLVERKNGWQVAEEMGEATPYAMQYLLDRARWDCDGVRDGLRKYVYEMLAAPNNRRGICVACAYAEIKGRARRTSRMPRAWMRMTRSRSTSTESPTVAAG